MKINMSAVWVVFLFLAISLWLWMDYKHGQDKLLDMQIDTKTKYFKEITGLATKLSFATLTLGECCKRFPGAQSERQCAEYFDKRRYTRMQLVGKENLAELVFGSGSKEMIQEFVESDTKNGEACPLVASRDTLYEELFRGKRQELVDFFANNIRKDQRQLGHLFFAPADE
jgi:hypothetical protein